MADVRPASTPVTTMPAPSAARPAQAAALVARLRDPRPAAKLLPAAEPARTERLLAVTRGDPSKLQALARLWAVPRAALDTYEAATAARRCGGSTDWAAFYRDVVATGGAAAGAAGGHGPEARLFRILAAAGGDRSQAAVCPEVVGEMVSAALRRSGSPHFATNMTAAVATVLFALEPDRRVTAYKPAVLARAGLCASMRRLEVSNEFVGCLSGLESSKFVAMLRDLSEVEEDSRGRDGPGFGPCPCGGSGGTACEAGWVSLGAVTRYSERRDLLTRRAVQAVFKRHGRRAVVCASACAGTVKQPATPCRCSKAGRWGGGSSSSVSSGSAAGGRTDRARPRRRCRCKVGGSVVGSVVSLTAMDYESDAGTVSPPSGSEADDDSCPDDADSGDEGGEAVGALQTQADCLAAGAVEAMSGLDFVRLYLALVRCGTDGGVRYWFSVLDVDGDGYVSCADGRHFYAERRRDGERRLCGTVLCEVESVWTRVCGSAGGSEGGSGDWGRRLSQRDVLRMGKADREFLLCALLIRRVDDVQLVDVAATERLRQSPGFAAGVCLD
jgi:hypothetical protein